MKIKFFLTLIFLILFSVFFTNIDFVSAEFPNTPDDDLWVTNGQVYDSTISSDGGTLYVAGDFTYVGPNTGSGAPFDIATGLVAEGFPKVGDNSGSFSRNINAVISDGLGGWYIGGDFTKVGDLTRNRIAHILSDYSVDASFDPNASGVVRSLVLSSDRNTLYVGGDFTTIGGQTRNRIAALSTSTGLATSWDPNSGSSVYSLALSSDNNTVYAGGGFTTIGGQTRNRIAAISTSIGIATSWNPNSNERVLSIVVSSDGNTIYVGGELTTIGGQTRNRIAALDASTGLATAWDPNAGGIVRSVVLNSSENIIYAGGSFTTIGGQTRNYIAALDASTGLATAWNPNAGNAIYALAISPDNNMLFAGGSFTTIGGQSRSRMAAIDIATGLATSWDPNSGNTVYALAVNSNNIIYIGGIFTSIGGQSRNGIAALSTTTGLATSWNPGASSSGSVLALALSTDDNTIYAGGTFTSIGGQSRSRIAALDTTTGLATSWNPNSGSSVYTLILSPDDSILYTGGAFNIIGGQSRSRIAALDTTTGLATVWNPGSSSGSAIRTIRLNSDGSVVYVGGDFTTIGGQSRSNIAALDASTGLATSWNPNSDSSVYSFSLSSDNNIIYTSGWFTLIGGQSRNGIAALDAATGLATSWNPNSNSYLYVARLSADGNTVYVGGAFTTIGGQSRSHIAALDTTTGLATSWNPSSINNYVRTIAINSNSMLFFGGIFTGVGGNTRDNTAIYYLQYTLTYTAGSNGSLTGTSPQTVNSGASGTAVTAVPATGYYFVNWSDASTANPRTDTNVVANVSVTANFAINTYTLTYTAGSNGSITGTSPQTTNYGSDGSAITAVPNSGYQFVDWSDGSTNNPRTDTNITANITVTANFEIIPGGGSIPVVNPPAVGDGARDASVSMGQFSNIETVNNGGVNLLTYVNSPAQFSLSGGVGGNVQSSHTIEVVSLDLNTKIAVITIHSEPITLSIKLDETKEVDLDKDGNSDIKVKFEDIYINRAEFTILPMIAQDKISTGIVQPDQVNASTTPIIITNDIFYNKLKGRIILKVEDKGQAYYISPAKKEMYYLGRPENAFQIMRECGMGITDIDLDKIANIDYKYFKAVDPGFANKHLGKIFLQVQSHGEAWYINPLNSSRYFLGRPTDAFQVMKTLGLGISNDNFGKLIK